MPDYADFDDFVVRTRSTTLARAVLYCGRRADAEDAVQEAYLAAYLRWPELREPRAWVETTVRRRFARDAGRWRLRWQRSELEVPAPAGSTPEEEAAAVGVLRTVALLPPRQRQVLVMVCLEGLSYRQVAEEVGISVGAVGANLAKAREKLTVLLGLTPTTRDAGDPLVAAVLARTGPGSGFDDDPLTVALRRAEQWLARGFDADQGSLRRLRAALFREEGDR
ncbi:sigma-70 family RNA polymerase sigma factor [Micromonospora sp. WMMD882]|uniref:RNA polymerase sigma factor n=1 Tax=Micromonospora sp. WMMD882 TaxID=3015151 RepID=UPI00248AB997|nr:sigma-70 family RNA polymerase sigma factor [Micromonospora sp. WMMD882]WBB80661.1 sigma-70 family RNA polymerase sigma factor [Micromonospora sp. WMMD882]